MSQRIGDTFFISQEPDGKCEFCQTVTELRPYGPNGERICFTCAMKDEETTKRKFAEALNGATKVETKN